MSGPWLLFALALPGPLTAQERGSLVQLDAEYRVAQRAYQAALAAEEAQKLLLDEVFIRIGVARSRGDESALEEAHGQFQTESRELMRLEAWTRDTRDALVTSREGLLAALDEQVDALEAELQAASNPATRQNIRDRLGGLTSQYQALENTVWVEESPSLFSSASSIVFDDRDGQLELQTKAEILERRARDAEALIADYAVRIDRLETRLRIERESRDFLGGVNRFGDDVLRTGAQRPTAVRQEGVPADSTAAEQNIPLEERIAQHREIQARLAQQRDEFLALAQQFRERLRLITQ